MNSSKSTDKSRLIAAIIVFGLMFLGIVFSIALDIFSTPNVMARNGVIIDKGSRLSEARRRSEENDNQPETPGQRYYIAVEYKYFRKINTNEVTVPQELYEKISIGEPYSLYQEEIRSNRRRRNRGNQ